jgi:hypothetical protein
MEIFKKDWLISNPIDYELKYYMLKDSISKLNVLISNGKLFTAMSVVESELHLLYNIKYEKDLIVIDERLITGINLDTMDLDYKYPDSNDIEDKMYEICDIAIENLEAIYKSIRDFWRKIELKCTITEIPDNKPANTKGFIMYIEPNSEEIEIYHYVEPKDFKMNWVDFKLTYVKSIKNNLRSIAEFIEICENDSNKHRFFRFDPKVKEYSKEESMIPLMKYMLFNRIKHGI